MPRRGHSLEHQSSLEDGGKLQCGSSLEEGGEQQHKSSSEDRGAAMLFLPGGCGETFLPGGCGEAATSLLSGGQKDAKASLIS